MAAPGEDVTRAELLTAYRFWVGEACDAVRCVAFIEGYEAVRKEYLAWCAQENIEPVHSGYIQQARAILPLLPAAVASLTLFVTKGFDSKSSYSLLVLKNKTRDYVGVKNDFALGKIRDETKIFFKEYRKIERDLKNYRNWFVAHADHGAVLGNAKFDLTPLKLISVANLAIHLVRLYSNLSGLNPVGTVGAPTISDNTLVVTSKKFAAIDAEIFWRMQFASWAPGFSNGLDG